jgi:hypothetical protein
MFRSLRDRHQGYLYVYIYIYALHCALSTNNAHMLCLMVMQSVPFMVSLSTVAVTGYPGGMQAFYAIKLLCLGDTIKGTHCVIYICLRIFEENVCYIMSVGLSRCVAQELIIKTEKCYINIEVF